jgi:hypothetical protein
VFTTGLAIVGSGLSLGWESGQFVGLALVALACPLSYRFFLGRSYKIVEAVATVSLLVHMWWLFGRFLLGG